MLAVLLMETTHHVQIVRVFQMVIMFSIIVMYVIMILRMIVCKIVQVFGVVMQLSRLTGMTQMVMGLVIQ